MNTSELKQKIQEMDNDQAERCLQALVRQRVEDAQQLADVIASPEVLGDLITDAAAQIGEAVTAVHEPTGADKDRAVRQILDALAGDEIIRPRLSAWIATARSTRIDPITSSIVLAGIVMGLSTHFEVEVQRANGKTKVNVHIEKKPTSAALIAKFFGFFKK